MYCGNLRKSVATDSNATALTWVKPASLRAFYDFFGWAIQFGSS